MDPTRAKLARALKVSDADIWSFKYDLLRDGFDVELRTGGHVLVTSEQIYALDDHRGNKTLPKYEPPTGSGPEVVTHDGSIVMVGTPVPASVAEEDDDDEASPFVPDGTSNDIIMWVDGDPQRASDALAKEREKAKPRVALIKQLERIADG